MALASLVLAAKVLTDRRVTMRAYAAIGGVSPEDMLAMEWALLCGLSFEATVPTSLFIDMVYTLRQHCAALAHTAAKRAKQAAAAAAIVDVVVDSQHGVATASPSPTSIGGGATERNAVRGALDAAVGAGAAPHGSASPPTARPSSSSHNSDPYAWAMGAWHALIRTLPVPNPAVLRRELTAVAESNACV